MNTFRILAAAALVIAGAGAGIAGEVTGNGKSLQLEGGGLHGKSACAYSGLEDAAGYGPGTVQNFGKHPFDTVGTGGVSDSRANIPNYPGPAAPGVACNPSEPS